MPKQNETGAALDAEAAAANGYARPGSGAQDNAAAAFHLVVIHPFGTFQKGERISDGDKIADVMAGENAHHCNKVAPA